MLLNKLEDDFDCSTDQDGYCILDGPCSEYAEEFSGYVLDLNFTSNSSASVRVPLATFVVDGPMND